MTSAVAKRRERERAERRDQILDAARDVFWREGFEAATMGDIAEAAQLGKGTLYLYFRDKDHLALGLAVRHQGELLQTMEQHQAEAEATSASGRELLRKHLNSYADHMQEPIEHLRMVMSRWATGTPFDPASEGCQRSRRNVARVFGLLRDAVSQAQREGELTRELTAEQLTSFFVSSLNGCLLMKLQLSCLSPPSPVTDAVITSEQHLDLLLDACRHLGGPRPSHVGAHQLEDAGQ